LFLEVTAIKNIDANNRGKLNQYRTDTLLKE
jgi:hypothetical protein